MTDMTTDTIRPSDVMAGPIRPSDDIKRRLRAGEPLTSKQIAADYNVTPSLLHTVVRSLEAEGLLFTKTKLGGNSNANARRYQRASDVPGVPPQMDEAQWGKGENVVSLQQKKAKATKAKAAKKSRPVSATPKPRKQPTLDVPVPALGAALSVAYLALDPGGIARLGLNNGTEAWLVTIDGYTKLEQPDGD